MAVVRWLLVGMCAAAARLLVAGDAGRAVGSRLSGASPDRLVSCLAFFPARAVLFGAWPSLGLGGVHQSGALGVSLSGCGFGPGAL